MAQPSKKTNNQYQLQAILNGDRKGIDYIYQQHLPRITHFILSNSGTEADAKDIFQEAIIIIYKKVVQGNFNLTASFYTYLYATCKNLWLKRLRRKKESPVVSADTETLHDISDWESTIIQEERFRLYRKKFRDLGKDCQQLLRLFFKRVKMEQIVDIMAYSSVSYTKKRKFQCKEKLIRLIRTDAEFGQLS